MKLIQVTTKPPHTNKWQLSGSNTKRLINITSIVGILITLLGIYFAYKNGLLTSTDKLEAFTLSLGIWGPISFIFIQLIQVVFPIIPGGVTCVAGIMIFGPVWGFIYNYIGIIAGSIINFALARYYGQSFIRTFVSDKIYDKYASWLEEGKRFEKLFALAIFLPIAPDDFLCMLAGLTQMTYKKFTAIIILGKPASLLLYSVSLTSLVNFIIQLAT